MRVTIAIIAVGLVAIVAAMLVKAELQRVRQTNLVHAAASRRDFQRVTQLLDSGIPVDQVCEDRVFGVRVRAYPYSHENGVTPLYVAVCKSDLKTVKLLLERGADVNFAVNGPYSILQRGVTQFFGSVDIHGTGLPPEQPGEIKLEIVRRLVEAGANVHERKYHGAESAIDMCDRMELPHVKQLLESKSVLSSPQTQTSN
jgi:ankyrin repeat protein